MAKLTIARTDGLENKEVHFESFPTECPICHNSIQPIPRSGTYFESGDHAQIVFLCTFIRCRRLFIADYLLANNRILFEQKAEPIYPKKRHLPDRVSNLSLNFVKIYNQAFDAEDYRLNELVGMGLRKALEFLIKDFCIHLKPSEEERIKKIWLSECIKKYIPDDRIKNCAELATWLGNDETHYVPKWEDKDISDLKNLIRLTMYWIESHLETEDYTKSMNP